MKSLDQDSRKYVIYPGFDHVFRYLFEELREKDNCCVIDEIFTNIILKKMWDFSEIHPTLNYKINVILSYITSYFLNIPYKNNAHSVYIFSNISIRYVSIEKLKKLQRKNAKIVLFFLDSVCMQNSRIAFEKVNKFDFDLIYTFDLEDSKKYGFIHFYTMYSKLKVKPIDKKYDAIFIGSDKGRFSIIRDIYELCKDKARIFISIYQAEDNSSLKYKDTFQINRSMDYKEVIRYSLSSNCLIDIVADKQSGLSLRAMEAIVYNKKLLTNNPAIKNFPYYNEKYMKLLNDISDTNVDFLIKDELVEYNYGGEYSPCQFIKNVEQKLKR